MRSIPRTSTDGGISTSVISLISVLVFFLNVHPSYAIANPVDVYTKACDGSAAVAIGPSDFISASDEDNVLRTYRYGQSEPTQESDLSYFLQLEEKGKEVDIEGAAKIGDRIYWIGSHSRDKKGNKEPDRARLFATEIRRQGDNLQIIPVGVSYSNLKDDLSNSDELLKYKFKEASKIAPQKRGGLNIEGLAATPDGKLLIAFRNPLYKQKALIIPLKNPDAVINGKRAELESPILLSLDGYGVRSIEYSPAAKKYLIVAGSAEGDAPDSDFKLYEWAGPDSTEVSLIRALRVHGARIQPEVVFMQNDSDPAYILSDDGELDTKSQGIRCKDLPVAERSFRGFAFKR